VVGVLTSQPAGALLAVGATCEVHDFTQIALDARLLALDNFILPKLSVSPSASAPDALVAASGTDAVVGQKAAAAIAGSS
jgi:hypothetical protein